MAITNPHTRQAEFSDGDSDNEDVDDSDGSH